MASRSSQKRSALRVGWSVYVLSSTIPATRSRRSSARSHGSWARTSGPSNASETRQPPAWSTWRARSRPEQTSTWWSGSTRTKTLLTDLQSTLESDPVAGRHIVRWLLPEPITLTPLETPEGVVWEYLGRGALDRLLTGKVPRSVAIPRPALSPGFIPWWDERSVTNRDATELVPPG